MRSTLSILVVLATACASKPRAALPVTDPPVLAESRAIVVDAATSTKPVTNQSLASIGLDPEVIDRTIDPCDDFYQFACGGWIKKTEIPADKAAAVRTFVGIDDRNLVYEHTLLEQLRADPGDDPGARQLGAFYGSCMDEAAIEKLGLSALRPTLAVIDSVKDARTLATAVAALHLLGVPALFALQPAQDAVNARLVIAGIDQGGMAMTDRAYYLDDDDQTRALRVAYLAYVEDLLAALGHAAAHHEATAILALETAIARASKDRHARRDPRGTYHRLDRAGVARAMPRFDWDTFWAAVGLKDQKDITVASPEVLVGVDPLLASTRPEVWRAYLAFQLVSATAPLLTKPIEEAQFKLLSSLTGQPELPPRWKRCVQRTERALGDLIGQRFVRDRFSAEARAQFGDQLRAMVIAMMANLDTLPWLDAPARDRAKLKLTALSYQIGYPDRWRTYGFKIDPRTWTANALAARRAERARQLAKIGKLVDKDDWTMATGQAAASYDPRLNRIVFPAAILQPPLYSSIASIPVNLGGIGVITGHELSHGFDAHGAQFDELGNLIDGWSSTTAERIDHHVRCLTDRYGSYEVGEHTRLNAANAATENLADVTGVKLAFAAFHQLRSSAPDSVVADGFTEDQQFFLGFGQSMCAKLRPEAEKLAAAIDVVSPPRWRVNGALAATPEFAAAFRCKAGSKMVPVQQCVGW